MTTRKHDARGGTAPSSPSHASGKLQHSRDETAFPAKGRADLSERGARERGQDLGDEQPPPDVLRGDEQMPPHRTDPGGTGTHASRKGPTSGQRAK